MKFTRKKELHKLSMVKMHLEIKEFHQYCGHLLSTHQLIKSLTYKLINLSTHQLISSSTNQLINL